MRDLGPADHRKGHAKAAFDPGDGESFLRASIAVAREYSGQIPSPNVLKAFVEDDDLADILIGLLNEISMVIFHFTDRMETMVEQCATCAATWNRKPWTKQRAAHGQTASSAFSKSAFVSRTTWRQS